LVRAPLRVRPHRSPDRDTACGQISRRGCLGSASAHQLSATNQELLLTPAADLRQQNLPRITDDLIFGERHHRPPAIAGMMLILSPSATGVSSSLRNRISSSL